MAISDVNERNKNELNQIVWTLKNWDKNEIKSIKKGTKQKIKIKTNTIEFANKFHNQAYITADYFSLAYLCHMKTYWTDSKYWLNLCCEWWHHSCNHKIFSTFFWHYYFRFFFIKKMYYWNFLVKKNVIFWCLIALAWV